MHFLDEVELAVTSGEGGKGCISFRRERFVPHGGPNGGDGGRGGDVILIARGSCSSLYPLQGRRSWRAKAGVHGKGKNCTGAAGEDLVIVVPVGTVVRDAERGNVLRDLSADGDQVRICSGGRGGRGNSRFASSTEQTPRRAEVGDPGETKRLQLELKLIADVGLVGLPNAGKSTLLSRLSAARPRIADYPFTTLEPMLGLVDAGQFRTFVVADIPGLVEGAHRGVGLGDRFLRHIERTRTLLHVVDLAPIDGTDPVEAYLAIRRELTMHPVDLEERPEVVAANKLDLLGCSLRDGEPLSAAAQEKLEPLREAAGDATVVPISAATGGALDRLVHELASRLAAE